MKSFRCRDAGVATCNAKVTGETEEEVLAKAVAHAREAHGVDIFRAETLVRYARTAVRDESSGSKADGSATGGSATGSRT